MATKPSRTKGVAKKLGRAEKQARRADQDEQLAEEAFARADAWARGEPSYGGVLVTVMGEGKKPAAKRRKR